MEQQRLRRGMELEKHPCYNRKQEKKQYYSRWKMRLKKLYYQILGGLALQ